MKKAIIGVAVAAALGVGGYFALNSQGAKTAIGDVAEAQITEALTNQVNQPLALSQLERNPVIEKATITVLSADKTQIKSELEVRVAVADESIKIPLNSTITRGDVEYGGKTYGYGKVVTKPDLSGFTDKPDFITDDTFMDTTYIGLDGSATHVTTLAAIQVPEEGINIGGITSVVNRSLINESSEMDGTFDMAGLNINSDGSLFGISPVNITYKMDKSGNYEGTGKSFTFDIDEAGTVASFEFGQFNMTGLYKKVEGLVVPISNSKTTFDNITANIEAMPVKLNNVVIEGGFYEKADKVTDIKIKLDADIDKETLENSGVLAMMPVKITPEKFSLEYAFNNVGYEVINTYYNSINNFESLIAAEGELLEVFSEEDQKKMLASLQKTGVGFGLNAGLETSEGDASIETHLEINEVGKMAELDALVSAIKQDNPQLLMTYLDGNADIAVDKGLVEKLGPQAGMMLMMSGAKESGSKYKLEAQIKDGQATVNGQPAPF